jgi:endonuclease YncB( thermonuclease family)
MHQSATDSFSPFHSSNNPVYLNKLKEFKLPIMKQLLLFLLISFTLFSPAIAQKIPKTIQGKVVRIIDGDTFDLLTQDSVKYRIRLNGIDCPERKQDYYQVCKDALSRYIFSKNVVLTTHGTDRWKRIIADVYVNDTFINYQMVRNGYAWHFKKYSKNKTLARAEEEAKKEQIGLWKLNEPVAPWKYRKPVKS